MRLRSARNISPISSPSGEDPQSSSPLSNAEVESRRHHEQSRSPQSSGSSPLSSPPDSDDLNDPFTKKTPVPKGGILKRTIAQVDSNECEGPLTRAGAKQQTPSKRRKVHFQDEVTDRKSIGKKRRNSQVVYLEGLDAPFKVAGKSILAKSDRSKEQKTWSRKYRNQQSKRAEAIKARKAEKLKGALGPDRGGSRASTPASFVSNTPSKRGKGNGRRGRGRGGRGGRGRGGGRAGRNEDSPEPPKKKILTEAEKEIVADLKARQTELKKFFKEVGLQQTEALNLLAARDLGKISRRSRAHEKVAEHQTVLEALNDRKQQAEDFARRKYELDLQQAKLLFDAEQEVIEQRYKTRCIEAKSEHHAGAQGDYLTAREAIQAMIDDNRTEPGSPDPTHFPRLHSSAGPDTVRGYYSDRITDEESLRRPPSSFDDAIRREVIDQDIISPTLFEVLDLPPTKSAKATINQPREPTVESSPFTDFNEDPTLTIQALAAEASSRLHKASDTPAFIPQTAQAQPPPTPPSQQDPDFGSWPLSRLADAAESESMRIKHPQNNHMSWSGPRHVDPFQPWPGFKTQDHRPPQPHQQNIPPIQWQPQMQHSSMSRPPPPPQQQAPSAISTSHGPSSHPLPPPRPTQQLQPSPRFIHHNQQQQQTPLSPFPSLFQHQQQHQQQPPPQSLPPTRPPRTTLHQQQQPAKQPRQPQRQRQPRPPTKLRPHHQQHQQQHHQQQQQPILQKPTPVTFVHQTVPPFPANPTANGRRGAAAATGGASGVGGAGGVGPGAGAGRSSGGLPVAVAPPPKGGQRILLPKKSP